MQILLVGNKVDLVDGTGPTTGSGPAPKREVSEEEARQWAQEHGLQYIETSAASGKNVVETFELTAKAIHALVQANKVKRPQRGSAFPSASGTSAASSCCS